MKKQNSIIKQVQFDKNELKESLNKILTIIEKQIIDKTKNEFHVAELLQKLEKLEAMKTELEQDILSINEIIGEFVAKFEENN